MDRSRMPTLGGGVGGGRRIQNRGHPWRVIWDDMRCWVRIVFCRGLLEDFLKIAEDLDIDACM